MPIATIGSMHLCFDIQGAGERLLFLGGTGWDLRRAPRVFDMPIAQEFTILAFDQRGQGRSAKPDEPYSMADYADDANALLDMLGWDRCHVMGVSFGGMVAQEFALRYPHRVRRLVLACATSGGAGGSSYPLHALADPFSDDYARKVMLLSDTRRDADWQSTHADAMEKMLMQARSRKSIDAGEAGHALGLFRQLQARAAHDTFDRLPALRMPVYICGGRYDGMAPAAALAALHQQIPGSMLELFEGGHQFYREDAQAFSRICAFLHSA